MYSKRLNLKRVNYNGETYILKTPVPICKKCGNEVAIIDDYDLDKDMHNLMSYCSYCSDKHYMNMDHKRFQIYQLPLDEDILYEKIYYQELKE